MTWTKFILLFFRFNRTLTLKHRKTHTHTHTHTCSFETHTYVTHVQSLSAFHTRLKSNCCINRLNRCQFKELIYFFYLPHLQQHKTYCGMRSYNIRIRVAFPEGLPPRRSGGCRCRSGLSPSVSPSRIQLAFKQKNNLFTVVLLICCVVVLFPLLFDKCIFNSVLKQQQENN